MNNPQIKQIFINVPDKKNLIELFPQRRLPGKIYGRPEGLTGRRRLLGRATHNSETELFRPAAFTELPEGPIKRKRVQDTGKIGEVTRRRFIRIRRHAAEFTDVNRQVPLKEPVHTG